MIPSLRSGGKRVDGSSGTFFRCVNTPTETPSKVTMRRGGWLDFVRAKSVSITQTTLLPD
jgi:hypothetical protein